MQPQLRLGRVVARAGDRAALDTPQFEAIFRARRSGARTSSSCAATTSSRSTSNAMCSRSFVTSWRVSIERAANADPGLRRSSRRSPCVRKSEVPQLWFGVEVTRRASWVFPLLMLVALRSRAIAVAKQHDAHDRDRGLRRRLRLPAGRARAPGRSRACSRTSSDPQVDISRVQRGVRGRHRLAGHADRSCSARSGSSPLAVGVGLIVCERGSSTRARRSWA